MKLSNVFMMTVALPAASCWELFVTRGDGGVTAFATGARGTKGCKRVSSSDARSYNIASMSLQY